MSIAQTINSSGNSGKLPRQTSSFDEYQSNEHYQKQGKQRPTFINRPTHRGTQNQNEFARATINSISSRGENSTEDEQENEEEDIVKAGLDRPFPELFRGTGQNGQILKEDLKNWSRKLHNETPPDIMQPK